MKIKIGAHMEIKECKSSGYVRNRLEQKVKEIVEKSQSNYKNKIEIYRLNQYDPCFRIGEVVQAEMKVFGHVIHKYYTHNKLLVGHFDERTIRIEVYDSVIYPMVKEEFTKFAEEYTNDIKGVYFIKDF